MNVAIIEDEPLIAKNLQRLLKQIDAAIEVVAVLDSVSSSVKWLKENKHPNLLFMDIQVADGVSFDIFNKVKIESPVIFTTAYNEYAIRAFKVNSVDYLLKPIDKEQLQLALEKFKKYFGVKNDAVGEQFKSLLENMQNKSTPKFKERFLAHYKAGIVPVAENRVSYFMKDVVIYLVTNENEKMITDYNTIDEIEETANPEHFFRANRQCIIHINEIHTYKKHDTGKIEVHLTCDKNIRIDVSREKANAFVEWVSR